MRSPRSAACAMICSTLLIAVIVAVLSNSAHAAVTATHLTQGVDATQQNVYATASISPSANRLVLAWVMSSENGGAPLPTLTGNGLTWVQVNTVVWNTDYRLTLFRAMGAAPTAGAVTMTFPSNQKVAAWTIDQYAGVDTSGTNGSGAVVQNLTGSNDAAGPAGLTITLPLAIGVGNATAGGFGNNSLAISLNPGAGYTGFAPSSGGNPPLDILSEWRAAGSTTVNATQTGAFAIAGIAVEIKTAISTIGNGTAPSNKTVYGSDTNKAVDAFTLVTSGGTDTVTALTVTFSGTAVGDVAAGGVKIWRDNGTTPNEWDASDTLIATASFVGNTAAFSGLSIPVTTTSTQYLITYDIAASPGANDTLQAAVTAATVTNTLANNDAVDATLTVTKCPGGIVTTTADAGNRTLRECINYANANPGTTISFNIATAANQSSGGDSWWRISPASALPAIIANGTVIDGTTQTTNQGNTNSRGPEIEINGAGAGANVDGLTINNAANVTIKSLVINGFNRYGIYMTGAGATGNAIYGNYIGTNAIGTAAVANAQYGVYVYNGPSNNNIGGPNAGQGNVISGNTLYGVRIEAANNNRIRGNYIGANASANGAIANGSHGVYIHSVNGLTLGGTAAGEGNVVSGNSGAGINITNIASSNITILGNKVGTDSTGTAKIANSSIGVSISNASSSITIGGSASGASNIISGNGGGGISISGAAFNISIYGNSVGTGATGTEPGLGNDSDGIAVSSSAATPNIKVGGVYSGEGNLIVNNRLSGVHITTNGVQVEVKGNTIKNSGGYGIYNQNASGVVIAKNLINGTGWFFAADGIFFDIGAINNKIYQNTIHAAGRDGIRVGDTGATIKNNIITGSTGYGINRVAASMTEAFNDVTDAATIPANTGGRSNVALDATDLNVNPLYTNAAAGDFTLQNASPAINRGVDLAADQPDMNGAAAGLYNGYAPDMGYWESAVTTTCPVSSTADSGAGTLRACITYANANPGTTIRFSISSGDPGYQTSGSDHWWQIAPTSVLPTITAAGTIVDGSTQTATMGNTNSLGPEIELNGTNAGAGNGLTITGGNTTIRGLIINRFTGWYGIDMSASGGNTIVGNYIGLNAAGTAAPTALFDCLRVNGTANNTIGGTTAADRNVIGGAQHSGVYITGAGATGNVVKGNYLGTNAAGTAAIANGDAGVSISAGTGNTVGGTAAGAGNLISGNTMYGVSLFANGNTVVGNYIGTNAAGDGAVGNQYGVLISAGTNNTVGGTTASERNIISGNSGAGVYLTTNAASNTIIGNYIGTTAAGTGALGNHYGVFIWNGAHNNTIGGTASGEGNIIANSTGGGAGSPGIYLNNAGTIANIISGNSIFSNEGLGIDILPAGVGTGSGANNDKLRPTITSITPNGSNFDIAATVTSGDTIEFFRVNNAASPVVTPDATGSGEGYLYLGKCIDNGACSGPYISGAADANGAAGTVKITLTSAGTNNGDYVTATATDAANGTSEFAANYQAISSAISGRVFEDFMFAGTASDWDGGVNNLGLANAEVELYDNLNTYMTFTTTASGGTYTFSGLANGTYKVRVRTATIGDSNTPPKGGFNGACAITDPASGAACVTASMTWGNGTPLYGGQGPATDDTATNKSAGPGSTYVSVTLSGSDLANVNFGFAYNLIVNTNNGGAGSLRQFISNANAIGSTGGTTASSSQFRMQVATNQSSGGDAWWRITTATALPAITDNTTTIDGSTQRTNAGSNPNSKGPEIEIFGNGITASGLSINGATGTSIRELVINSFAGISPNGDSIYLNNATNTTITGCYLGTNAIASAALSNGSDGIEITGTSSGTIIGGSSAGAGNIISGNSVRYGIELSGTSNSTVIKGNTIGTGFVGTENLSNRTGIMVNTSAAASNNVIGGVNAGEGNVVANSSFEGIYMSMSGTGDTILGNTVRNNGTGGGGIYCRVAGVVIAKNVSYSNAESGITLAAGANNNKVYQNTVNANTGGTSDGIQVTGNGAIIRNNIATGNGRYGINRIAAAMTESYNDVTDAVTAPANALGRSNVALDSTDLNANPLYINAAGGNFSLTECTSPAINRGIDLGADQPDMNGGSPGLWNNNAPDLGAFETSSACTPALTIVKQLWVENGSAPITSPVNAASGSTLVFLIYVKNTTAGQVTDVRINDNLDQTGFDYVTGSLFRTSALLPPADTASDLAIFNATAPGTGDLMTDGVDGDVGSAQDTGAPVGVDRITVGQATNASLTITGNTTFAFRFQVKVK